MTPDIHWPQELIDLIVDELNDSRDQQRFRYLGQCMFVSKSFYNRSREHIFHSIEVDLHPDKPNISLKKLRDILEANRAILLDIRSFSLVLHHHGGEPHKKIENPDFYRILTLVGTESSVHAFAIRGVDTRQPRFNLELFSPDVLGAISTIRASPNLRILHLTNLHSLSPAIGIEKSLQQLTVHGVYPQDTFLFHEPFLHLRHLKLRGSQSLSQFFTRREGFHNSAPSTPIPAFPSLETLEIALPNNPQNSTTSGWSDTLGSCPLLWYLHLIISTDASVLIPPWTLPESITIQSLHSLQHLSISNVRKYFGSSAESTIFLFDALLRTRETPGSLRSLNMNFYHNILTLSGLRGILLPSTPSEPRWSRIDSVLTSGNFPFLEDVTLKLILWFDDDHTIESVQKIIEEAWPFPKLSDLLPLTSKMSSVTLNIRFQFELSHGNEITLVESPWLESH